MDHLETPAFLAFCHQLPLIATLGYLSSQQLLGGASFAAVTSAEVRAAIPAAALEALQLILLFAMVNHTDAVLVVAATCCSTAVVPTMASGWRGIAQLSSTQRVRAQSDSMDAAHSFARPKCACGALETQVLRHALHILICCTKPAMDAVQMQ